MRLFALFFLLGTLIIQQYQTLPSLIWIGLFLSFSIFLTVFFYKRSFSFVFVSTSALLAGLLLSTAVAKNQLDKRIPQKWEGQDIILQGKVQGIPNTKEDGIRFRFKISQASLKTDPEKQIDLKGIVRLGWYRNVITINADETWQLLVRMKRSSGFMNPGGVDYEKWLFTERISATGYIREKTDLNKRLDESPWWSIDRMRQTIHHNIQQGIEDKASAAILSALVVAIRTELDNKQWKQLQQTGTSHLVAISGLHIAVVAGFAFLPIMLIWGLFPSLNEKIPRQVAGAIVGVIFATAYAMLAGFTLPTQRALLMVVIALLGLLVRRHYQPSTILAVVVIAVLLLDPLAGMTVSFWLSFLAVTMILIILNRQIDHPVMSLIKLQILLSLGMLPLTLFFFGSASLLSPVANLIAIPWVSLIIVPLSLIALVFMPISTIISNGLFSISALAIKWMFAGFGLLTESSLAKVTFAEIPSDYLLFAFAGFLFLLLPKGFPARWLGLIAILPALLFTPEKPKQGEFTFTLLDAGQGMASVLQTENHTLIYDVGTRYSDTYDIGKLVVVPYLKSKGLGQVDSMVLSHNDIDHWGGAEAVLKEIKVSTVISSDTEILENQSVTACTKGDNWQWDGVNFEILSPPKKPSGEESDFPENANDFLKKDNNKSCVIRVSNGDHSILLTGDIEKKTEKLLLDNSINKLATEVIIMPHHGSKTSSTESFIQAVSPELALIPAGYRNRFGHPKEKVLNRYQEMGIPVMGTINSGAITINFPNNKEKYQTNSYRAQKRGFWSR
jgi:competence protein ComEC